jgi:hypothetical protein
MGRKRSSQPSNWSHLMRSPYGTSNEPKRLWLRPPMRYSAHLWQPLALDWMAASLPIETYLKTCLSCPSPEPETNWHSPRGVARRLNGTARGNRCVSRSQGRYRPAGSLRGTLNLYRCLVRDCIYPHPKM